MLLTSSLKVLSSLYLSSASQMKLGWFMAGLSILGPAMLYGLSAVAAAITCIADVVASVTGMTIASFAIACSLAILICYLNFLFLYLPK